MTLVFFQEGKLSAMKSTQSLLSMLLTGTILVFLWGCGGGEPPKPIQKVEKKESAKPAQKADVKEAPKPAQKVEKKEEAKPLPKSAPPVQQAAMGELSDFASLKNYPDLAFKATENEAGNGDPRSALVDGAPLLDDKGARIYGYWCAPTPAHMEIALSDPKGSTWISVVEVEGNPGDYSFPECSINIKTKDNNTWHAPEGLTFRTQSSPGPDASKTGLRHVFSFLPVPATDVQITIPKGGKKRPDRAYVRDIDVLGVVK